jgi:bifunctional DNA-binding transcriptional regulator/antitoxin component of YhaV-PrlF toxin-antitoxin module
MITTGGAMQYLRRKVMTGGRVTIPVEYRRDLDLQVGAEIEFVAADGVLNVICHHRRSPSPTSDETQQVSRDASNGPGLD